MGLQPVTHSLCRKYIRLLIAYNAIYVMTYITYCNLRLHSIYLNELLNKFLNEVILTQEILLSRINFPYFLYPQMSFFLISAYIREIQMLNFSECNKIYNQCK